MGEGRGMGGMMVILCNGCTVSNRYRSSSSVNGNC